MTRDSLYEEAAYARALEGVAQGATRHEVESFLHRTYPALTSAEITTAMGDALDGALSCGIEREDIDESWGVS